MAMLSSKELVMLKPIKMGLNSESSSPFPDASTPAEYSHKSEIDEKSEIDSSIEEIDLKSRKRRSTVNLDHGKLMEDSKNMFGGSFGPEAKKMEQLLEDSPDQSTM